MNSLDVLGNRVIAAASDPNGNQIGSETQLLCDWLRSNPDSVNSLDLEVVKSLKRHRHFAGLQQLCETLGGAGHRDPFIRLCLAQSLIDEGCPSTAIDVLRKVADKPGVDLHSRNEANGLIGRAFKDLFLACGSGDTSRRAVLLNLAIEHYAIAFEDSNSKNFWTGENLIALLTKAEQLGINVEGQFNRRDIADAIAKVIEETVAANRSYWQWATLAVVDIARGNWKSANSAMAEGLKKDNVTAFKVGGTVRQLCELWGIDESGSEGAGLLLALQSRLLQLSRGHVEMSVADMKNAQKTSAVQFEKVFGVNGPQTHAWLQRFISRGKSVGLICNDLGRGVGTCFIVAGEEFHEEFKGERLILTNDHVVSPNPRQYPASPPLRVEKALVTFELFNSENGKCTIAAKEIIWSSSAWDHDACLIRLESELPDELEPLPLTHFAPIADGDPPESVYIIGHPNGGVLSYSMHNNELLDHECEEGSNSVVPSRIHYVTPTQPGSSGSPAMNADMDVIGLHHAGSNSMRRLDGSDDTYRANEAVWISSICLAARVDIAAKRSRWIAE